MGSGAISGPISNNNLAVFDHEAFDMLHEVLLDTSEPEKSVERSISSRHVLGMPSLFPDSPTVNSAVIQRCTESWSVIISSKRVDRNGTKTAGITSFTKMFTNQLKKLKEHYFMFFNLFGSINFDCVAAAVPQMVSFILSITCNCQTNAIKLARVGQMHRDMNIPDIAYPIFILSFLSTISRMLASTSKPSPLTMDAWVNLCAFVLKGMLAGAELSSQISVENELRRFERSMELDLNILKELCSRCSIIMITLMIINQQQE